jgi:hypothetical protein
MSVPCQHTQYKYQREPSLHSEPPSAQWQRTSHVVSQLPEAGDPGFLHQSGEKDTFSVVFVVPYSGDEEVFRTTQIEYEGLADARFQRTHPGQELVDSAASHSPGDGVANTDAHPELP